MAILVPCLVALRNEFNGASPHRDKASDGWLGNRAHSLSSSDHNPDESGRTPYEDADDKDEVHALDVDDSGPWPWDGWFDRKVELIRVRHRDGIDDRLQNIIRNRRIASRSWGWDWRPYTGASPHTEHAHFSARYTTAQENDTSYWGVYRKDRVVAFDEFDVKMPVLKLGDDDDDPITPDRTWYVHRLQRQLKIVDDGTYGPKTAAAIREMMDNPSFDGRTVNEAVWRRLFALGRP